MPPGGVPILVAGRCWITAKNKERTSERGTARASLQALPASAITDISRRERSPRGAADGARAGKKGDSSQAPSSASRKFQRYVLQPKMGVPEQPGVGAAHETRRAYRHFLFR